MHAEIVFQTLATNEPKIILPSAEMMRPNAGFHADQARGTLASRVSTWVRDHFWRSTMAPRSSRPTMWNEFLPISMPITIITTPVEFELRDVPPAGSIIEPEVQTVS